jgi:hypothetical protein
MESVDELRAMVLALAARVEELEDEREIRDLLAHYAYNADCMRDERWVQLWTDDAVYDLTSTVNYPDGSIRKQERNWTGVEGMRDLITDPLGHHRPGFYGHSMHAASVNMTVQIDGDTAVANTYSYLYQEQESDVQLVSAASNEWLLSKVDGRWAIRERHRGQVGTPSFAQHLGATDQ